MMIELKLSLVFQDDITATDSGLGNSSWTTGKKMTEGTAALVAQRLQNLHSWRFSTSSQHTVLLI